MTYATLNDVKKVLGIALNDSSEDTQISDCLDEAHEIVENALKPFCDVPLSSPPNIVVDAEANIAAEIYKNRYRPEREIVPIEDCHGMHLLNVYIAAEYGFKVTTV